MPLEPIQIYSSNKTYAIRKKIHTFFLLLKSLILQLNYLYDCRSSISEIHPCSIPLKILSNSTGLIWLDSSRKIYVQSTTMTQLWIGSVEWTCTTCHVSLFPPFALKSIQKHWSRCTCGHFLHHSNPVLKERAMNISPQSPLWDEIRESEKDLTSTDHIS